MEQVAVKVRGVQVRERLLHGCRDLLWDGVGWVVWDRLRPVLAIYWSKPIEGVRQKK